ncbi:E3 ubiquitin ligase PARAQUAT TOLERANCE 3-like isoform X2 [Macadamia integrifolia]|uniref:E3 ubiquitin ligase PARAQUAT TOLERANCE 3-like isoform X2 n=1 Tax=Macadamia integrifolia TaxID=60698 RepID=UPI001C4EB862|nr:E3 ubiquitin ligase PARAQUAT TOLERANCE 3-like isoform X2 [Macadamia integrifolia]
MAVYYKFKSAKDYDSISIDGHFISVANLKEKIFESKHLGRGTDFDLMVANAQTNEEYIDEATLIPKNTSVLIRRVPGRPRMNIVAEQDEPKISENKVEDAQPAKSSYTVPDSSVSRFPEESEWDEFGNDLYAIPEVLPVQSSNQVLDAPPPNKADEDSKIKALIDTPALDWQRQTQDGFGSGRGFGRGMGGRMMGGRGFGRAGGGLERKTPPVGYICHRCKVPGHFIQHCPTNGDPNYDIKRVKPPTGIPKSMLMTTPDGSYALPSGAVAVLKPNEAAFEKEIEGLPSTRSVSELPPELRCPLCKEVMKDAVLTSKCCFKSFCDKCIRDHLISKSICVCGATNILADDLLPNKTLRDTINRILESNNSSADNAGSMLQLQDMESARPAQPKVPSPTFSATSKGEHVPPPSQDITPDLKDTMNEKKPTMSAPQPSVEKGRTAKTMDFSEATRESASMREATSQCSAPLPEEEVQQKLQVGELGKKKKKKKARLPLNAADMQWRSSQDLAPENYMMPLGPSAYNPYWSGMQQFGMDGYVAPYSGAMPYMGYAPGLFDVPFGGMVPQDPFGGGQGFMLPVVPPQRDLSELAMGPYPVQQQQILSREEFEARKADLRRKREIDLRRERERSKERDSGREVSSSGDVSSMRSKPRPMAMSHMGSADQAHFQRTESERASSRERFSRDSESTRYGKKRSEHPPRHDDDYHDHHHRHEQPQQHHHRHHQDDDDVRTTSVVEAAAPKAGTAADRKMKGSVFSRISFPEEGSSKKRKLSSSTEEIISKEVAANGYKELEPSQSSHSRPLSNGYRDEWKPPPPPVKGGSTVVSASASSGTGVVGRRKGMVDHDSSDDERHFKRRPSRYEPPPPPPDEWEDETRPSRSSRERERDRDRGRDHERERGYSSSKHR